MTSELKRINAAVLVPVYRAGDDLRMVMILRTGWGIHGDQVGFPGGKRSPEDASFQDTALREAEEEIGLSAGHVEVLAALDPIETVTTGYRVYPFVGRIMLPDRWRLQPREVAETIDVSVTDVMRPENHGVEAREFPTWPGSREMPFYSADGRHIWGLTYRILRTILPRLDGGEWVI